MSKTMPGEENSWRQLREVLGALIVKIEPAPASSSSKPQGKQATRR